MSLHNRFLVRDQKRLHVCKCYWCLQDKDQQSLFPLVKKPTESHRMMKETHAEIKWGGELSQKELVWSPVLTYQTPRPLLSFSNSHTLSILSLTKCKNLQTQHWHTVNFTYTINYGNSIIANTSVQLDIWSLCLWPPDTFHSAFSFLWVFRLLGERSGERFKSSQTLQSTEILQAEHSVCARLL